MTVLAIGAGLAIVVVVLVDVLWTTLAVGAGGGPITDKISTYLWSLIPRGHGPRQHRLLQVLGIVVTLTVLTLWIVALLAGWLLVFTSAPDAVVNASTGQPADFWSRLYFSGYTIFTLGIGDYRPSGGLWQILTVLATGSGLFLVTLAITYLVSVMSSAVQKRQLASQIFALGRSPHDIVARAWDGTQLRALDSHLQSLAPVIASMAQRHLAYPVLHYFHSVERNSATAPSIAMLDELLTLLEHGIAEDRRPARLVTAPVRDAVSEFLDALSSVFRSMARRLPEDPPAVPALCPLRECGVPTVAEEEWRENVDELADRRTKLLAFVAADRWHWDDVWQVDPDTDRSQ